MIKSSQSFMCDLLFWICGICHKFWCYDQENLCCNT